jgi:hypothetical protein
VFLRWGILGILSVAALVYAYNASKRLAESHERRPAANVPAPASEEQDEAEPAPEPESESEEPLSPHCEVELLVARRAAESRRQSEPLDRVLRMQEIAWQEPAQRRERLELVATRWFEHEPVSAEALKNAVVSDCEAAAPAP